MTISAWRWRGAFRALTIAVCFGALLSAQDIPQYSVQFIGAGYPRAVNDNGEAVGWAIDAGVQRAWYWDGTQFQGIFTNSSLAQGNQVGWATFGADILAGKITDGTWQLQSGSGGSWKVLDRSGTGSDFTNIVPAGACQPLWPF